MPLNRTLVLAPLPSLPDDKEKRHTWFRKIEQEIVEETRQRHRAEGITCGPPEALCWKDPHYAPAVENRSPAPGCHAACRAVRSAFCGEMEAFVRAWREALERFKRCAATTFPPGGWWPYHCQETLARQLE